MTEFLSQNKIRFQLLKKLLVNLVNVASALSHFPVNLQASVDLLVNRRLRPNRPIGRFMRIITRMAHRDNLVSKTDSEWDLCAGRKQGANSHFGTLSLTS